MKKYIIILNILLLVCFKTYCQKVITYQTGIVTQLDTNRAGIKDFDNFDKIIGHQFKDFSAFSYQGNFYSQKSLIGKITLINFWFGACPSCHLLFPKLNDLKHLVDKDSSFQVVSMTFDNINEVKENALKWDLKYPIISIERDSCTQLNFFKGYPINFLTDETGKIIYVTYGFGKLGSDVFTEELMPLIKDSLLKMKNEF